MKCVCKHFRYISQVRSELYERWHLECWAAGNLQFPLKSLHHYDNNPIILST